MAVMSTLRISREQANMQHAEIQAARSTCSRARVGVVIAREGRILSTGYNGAPAGMEHCWHSCTCEPHDLEDMSGRKAIVHDGECHSLRPCFIAVHAEANAIGYAARYGMQTQSAELYTTFCPCLACAQLILAAGIACVYYKNEYRDRSGLELLQSAGVDIMLMS